MTGPLGRAFAHPREPARCLLIGEGYAAGALTTLAERLREVCRPRRPLLVAVTGRGADLDKVMSSEAGIDLHLVKPVDPVALAGVLTRFEDVIGERVRSWPPGSGD